MSRTRSRKPDEPDESFAFDHGKVDWVVIADQTVGRTIHEPGWRWSTHIRPGGWLEPLESLNERVLATVVVTDIVDSTGHATRLGGSVHEAARVAAAAAEGEVLVTAITRDLAAGSGLSSRIEASTSSEGSTVFGEGSPPGERARPWGFP